MLKRLPASRQQQNGRPGRAHPETLKLTGLGEYRLTAFTGGDGDTHIAGLPTSGLDQTVRRLELVEVVVFGSALAVMALLGTGLIRLSLRPLDRVTATAGGGERAAAGKRRGDAAAPGARG